MIYVTRRYQSKIRNRKLICSTLIIDKTWQRNLWGFIGFLLPYSIRIFSMWCKCGAPDKEKTATD
jgi:hypothetical protein